MSRTVQKVISKSLEKPNPIFIGKHFTDNQLSIFDMVPFLKIQYPCLPTGRLLKKPKPEYR
jgi:hypothetical protein